MFNALDIAMDETAEEEEGSYFPSILMAQILEGRQAQQLTSVIPTLRRLMEVEQEFEATLGSIMS